MTTELTIDQMVAALRQTTQMELANRTLLMPLLDMRLDVAEDMVDSLQRDVYGYQNFSPASPTTNINHDRALADSFTEFLDNFRAYADTTDTASRLACITPLMESRTQLRNAIHDCLSDCSRVYNDRSATGITNGGNN